MGSDEVLIGRRFATAGPPPVCVAGTVCDRLLFRRSQAGTGPRQDPKWILRVVGCCMLLSFPFLSFPAFHNCLPASPSVASTRQCCCIACKLVELFPNYVLCSDWTYDLHWIHPRRCGIDWHAHTSPYSQWRLPYNPDSSCEMRPVPFDKNLRAPHNHVPLSVRLGSRARPT